MLHIFAILWSFVYSNVQKKIFSVIIYCYHFRFGPMQQTTAMFLALVPAVYICESCRNTWLACSYLPFSDERGRQAVQSCRDQSEGVKNETKGLQETGIPATVRVSSISQHWSTDPGSMRAEWLRWQQMWESESTRTKELPQTLQATLNVNNAHSLVFINMWTVNLIN